MAISKELLIQSVLLGFGDPAFSFIPNSSPWYSEEGLHKYGVEPLYNKEKAAQMLYEAGFGIKKDDKTYEARDRDGKPLKLTLLTSTGSKVSESMAFLVKQELSDIGIEVDLKLVPWPTLLGKYVRNKVPGSDQEPRFNNGKGAVSEEKWDLIIMGFSTNPIAPSGQDVFFTTDGGLNFWGYSNPEVDRLFQRARSKEALDKENRKKIYQELASLLSDDQPVGFLAYNKGISGFQKKVKGIEPGINMGYNYYLWYFE
jgi:peptide/nickel transport system substrate-binding protein